MPLFPLLTNRRWKPFTLKLKQYRKYEAMALMSPFLWIWICHFCSNYGLGQAVMCNWRHSICCWMERFRFPGWSCNSDGRWRADRLVGRVTRSCGSLGGASLVRRRSPAALTASCRGRGRRRTASRLPRRPCVARRPPASASSLLR